MNSGPPRPRRTPMTAMARLLAVVHADRTPTRSVDHAAMASNGVYVLGLVLSVEAR